MKRRSLVSRYSAAFLAVAGIALSLACSVRTIDTNADAKNRSVYRAATFDSGFGGFFTAKEIETQARDLSGMGYGPFEIAHYGDTANIPYGEKTPAEIAYFSSQGILTAFRDGNRDVFIACNTASTQFEKIQEILRAEDPSYPNRVFSIIEISVREVMKTVSKTLQKQDVVTVAVMATPATVKSEIYPRYIAKALHTEFRPGEFRKYTQPRWLKAKGAMIDSYTYSTELSLGKKKKVVIYQLSPANWVDMIEHGAPDAEKRNAVKHDLRMLMERMTTIDVVGEFCTHYPVFDSMIREEMKALGKVAPETPFIVQGPLMGSLFREQYLRKHPVKSAAPVTPPPTPAIYLSGTNIEATRGLVKKIFPGETLPEIRRKEFLK